MVVRDRSRPSLLFTAFEPSGDDHASAVIAELKRRQPELPIHAWGGPRMEAAGATIIERTGDDAVMGLPGIQKIREHKAINDRIDDWVASNPVTMHIPVDSPGANFHVCRIARKYGLQIVHLVAPQIWAWGEWRIRKLRRLTDLVLCLLPFEEGYFNTQGVPARFIGHPLFDTPANGSPYDTADLPEGSPRVAIMPGSRPGELSANFPLMIRAFRMLKLRDTRTVGLVAAASDAVEQRLHGIAEENDGWPVGLHVVSKRTDDVIAWADLAMVVSGTVTLQIARQLCPMVTIYKASPIVYHGLFRWIRATQLYTLPNLIAGREIVPELIPHFGGPVPIAARMKRMLDTPALMEEQCAELAKVCDRFAGVQAAARAADAIEEFCHDPPTTA